MTIKVGQIRMTYRGEKYCITHYHGYYDNDIIYSDGYTCPFTISDMIEVDELIAEYPTWQEAVNSKEFRGDR